MIPIVLSCRNKIKADKLSLEEQLAYLTVRIEATVPNGIQYGTGFLYEFRDEDKSIYVVISNKHVVKNTIKGKLVFSSIDNKGYIDNQNPVRIEVDNFERQWINHPDSLIDLAILPIGNIINSLPKESPKPYMIALNNSQIPNQSQLNELNAVEEVLMVGYPNSLWDKINNYPIFRRGITATHVANDFNGKREFLIDAACFPGSSGSPVLIANNGSYTNKNGALTLSSRTYLLGIQYAMPIRVNIGEIKVINIPTSTKLVSQTKEAINLGYVIKSNCILDFEPILFK